MVTLYQTETDNFTDWMVTTGQMLQCPNNLLGAGNRGRNNRNLTTENFVPLATYLAASTSPLFVIPLSAMVALDEAIYLRRLVSSTLIQQRKGRPIRPEVRRSDKTHEHFTKTLEDVRRILVPKLELRTYTMLVAQRNAA